MSDALRLPDALPCPICDKLCIPHDGHPCHPPELPPYHSRARIRVKLNGKRPTGVWDSDSFGTGTLRD